MNLDCLIVVPVLGSVNVGSQYLLVISLYSAIMI